MKRPVSDAPPPSLVAYELEPGVVMFVHELPRVSPGSNLSPAEREVLGYLLDGRDTSSIARARRTSPHTTENQIASIFRKLGVRSRAELAAKLLSDGGDDHEPTPRCST